MGTSRDRRAVVVGRHAPSAAKPGAPTAAVALAVIAVMLLLGGGLAAWWIRGHDDGDDPAAQALKIMAATKAQDYKRLDALTAIGDTARIRFPDPATFAADYERQTERTPEMKQLCDELARGISDVTAGVPSIRGDHADVPISSTVTLRGVSRRMNGIAHLVRADGAWKPDMTSNSPEDVIRVNADLMGVAQ